MLKFQQALPLRKPCLGTINVSSFKGRVSCISFTEARASGMRALCNHWRVDPILRWLRKAVCLHFLLMCPSLKK